jgi:hypothetical protein
MKPTGTSRAFAGAIGFGDEPEPSSLEHANGTRGTSAPEAIVAPIIKKRRRLGITDRLYRGCADLSSDLSREICVMRPYARSALPDRADNRRRA